MCIRDRCHQRVGLLRLQDAQGVRARRRRQGRLLHRQCDRSIQSRPGDQGHRRSGPRHQALRPLRVRLQWKRQRRGVAHHRYRQSRASHRVAQQVSLVAHNHHFVARPSLRAICGRYHLRHRRQSDAARLALQDQQLRPRLHVASQRALRLQLEHAQYVGVTIYDIVVNPTQPDSLYKINNFGHDSTWRHNVLYDFNWNTLNIWNVANPAAPVLIGSNDDPTIQSYHSGDESKDGHYLYVCDELAITPTPDIVIFNITNPASPQRVNYINDGTSRVHQLYVVGNLMFVGYYTSGFKVFDITNPALPVLADAYDTCLLYTSP